MWVIVILVLVALLWQTREQFEVPATDDPLLVSMAAPGANLATYVAIVKDFYNTIYLYDPHRPTKDEAISYLANQSIRGEDKEALAKILPLVFKDMPPEKQSAKFKPDKTKLQPEMAAEPVADNAKPAEYETFDKDPVMPKSKVMSQRFSLNRGGDATAYTWNPEAYAQDTVQSVPGNKPNPYLPKLSRTVEHMSTMAGVVTHTNEIYGPRIPKQKFGKDLPPSSELTSGMIPSLYGPGAKMPRPSENPYSESPGLIGPESTVPGAVTGSGVANLVFPGSVQGPTKNDPKDPYGTTAPPIVGETPIQAIYAKKPDQVGPGDLSVIATASDYRPIAKVTMDNTTKTEPVPFLGDFSKFYR
jgi:hypothetical protein